LFKERAGAVDEASQVFPLEQDSRGKCERVLSASVFNTTFSLSSLQV